MRDDRGPGLHRFPPPFNNPRKTEKTDAGRGGLELRRLRLLSWSWGRIVCQFSDSRNVTLWDRLYTTTPFRWLGSLNAKHPGYLTAGNSRSLDPFTQFVGLHLHLPEAQAATMPRSADAANHHRDCYRLLS